MGVVLCMRAGNQLTTEGAERDGDHFTDCVIHWKITCAHWPTSAICWQITKQYEDLMYTSYVDKKPTKTPIEPLSSSTPATNVQRQRRVEPSLRRSLLISNVKITGQSFGWQSRVGELDRELKCIVLLHIRWRSWLDAVTFTFISAWSNGNIINEHLIKHFGTLETFT